MHVKTYYDKFGNPEPCYEGFVASSSKVAASLAGGEPDGTDDRKEFGKRFEETYEQFCYKNESIMEAIDSLIEDGKSLHAPSGTDMNAFDLSRCPTCKDGITRIDDIGDDEDERRDRYFDEFMHCYRCKRTWHDRCDGLPVMYCENPYPNGDCEWYCNECLPAVALEKFEATWIDGVHDGHVNFRGEEGIGEAMLIAKAFIWSGIHGRTPSTKYRVVRDDLVIAAKPDLDAGLEESKYIEFKIYEGGEFTTMQSKVFSWVLDQPVALVTWNGKDVTKTVIDGRDLDLSGLPDSLFKETGSDGKAGGYHRYLTDDGKNVFEAWRLVRPRVPSTGKEKRGS
jgi:hypothetical protein